MRILEAFSRFFAEVVPASAVKSTKTVNKPSVADKHRGFDKDRVILNSLTKFRNKDKTVVGEIQPSVLDELI